MAKTQKDSSRRKNASRKKTARTKSHPRSKRAARKHVAKTELQYIPWHTIPLEDLNPLLQRQFVVGQDIMVARVLLKKGCIVPEHSHHNEQVSYVLDGVMKFFLDNREVILSAGEVLCIPPNMPHEAIALEDTVDLDIFNPPRQDWIDKDDAYLRQEAPVKG